MVSGTAWMIWPENPALSAIVLFLIAMPLLYAARRPMQGLFRAMTHAFSNPMRLGARWLSSSAVALRQRNRLVLLAHGREEAMKVVEREFERVTAVVKRDLQGYPALQRKVMDEKYLSIPMSESKGVPILGVMRRKVRSISICSVV